MLVILIRGLYVYVCNLVEIFSYFWGDISLILYVFGFIEDTFILVQGFMVIMKCKLLGITNIRYKTVYLAT